MNKDGVLYFIRHVPNDVQKHYERPRIVICLKTNSKTAALKASRSIGENVYDPISNTWKIDDGRPRGYFEDEETGE